MAATSSVAFDAPDADREGESRVTARIRDNGDKGRSRA